MNILRRLNWQIDREWIRVDYKGRATWRHHAMAIVPTIATYPLVALFFTMDWVGAAKFLGLIGFGTTFLIEMWVGWRGIGATGLCAVGRLEKFKWSRNYWARRRGR